MKSPARLVGLLALATVATTLNAAAASAAGPPQVAATWVTDVGASSANLGAEVNPNGPSTTYRFEYISEAAYQANLSAIPPKDGFGGALKAPSGGEVSLGSGEGALAVVQHIGGLKPSNSYRYRIVATNTIGATAGPGRDLRTEESAPVFALPDGRGWEMISPIDKNGGAIQGPGANFGGGVLQGAADGSTVTFSSRSSFGSAEGAPGASQYISRRTPGGWSTENVTLPTLSGAYGDHPDGVPYQLFSRELARGLALNGQRCGEAEACSSSYSLRESAGGVLTLSPATPDLRFAAASSDLKHLVLSTCAALTPDAIEAPGPEGCDPTKPNLYRWSGSTLTLVNLLPGDAAGTPGATLAAQSRAISTDGSRVYFSASGNLYLRDGAQTAQVDEDVGGGGAFQTATPNGSVAFLTKEGHLYRYSATAKTITDLTPGGEVKGVLGASEDGSYVYYLDLAGLHLWHGGTIIFVASAADPGSYPPSTGSARVSADGSHLAFVSRASLTGYDNNGVSEVFLYSTAGTLVCPSCNPTGGRPLGPSSIPGATANGEGSAATHSYKPRVLSADSSRLFFDSTDALVPLDTNADQDVYEWEAQGSGSCRKSGGCVSLISSGQSAEGASFIDASEDGSDVFFLTDGSLVPPDPGSVDLYDARIGGGFPGPPVGIPCAGDACQGLPGTPEDPTPGTLFVRPEGNPPASFPKARKKKHHKKHHHHKKRHQQVRGQR